ncbi:aldolase/citrate lyase family protein [Streptomyces sp. NPDC088387]|uniref:aldolase/citrate lyase family protein n=1 Tax=Streptomyces sp. NPDC088387 TaxID=3365859 RepID=UPI00380C63E9
MAATGERTPRIDAADLGSTLPIVLDAIESDHADMASVSRASVLICRAFACPTVVTRFRSESGGGLSGDVPPSAPQCAISTFTSSSTSPTSGAPVPETARVNPLIDLLEADKPVFSVWVNYYGVSADHQVAATAQANPSYDFYLYDLEHQPYDVERLRRFLQDLLDPDVLATQGRAAIKPVIARIPSAGRELNSWVVKQVLDAGVAGLMFPHIETAEEALAAVAAARYPQKPGAPDYEPEGRRGFSPAVPARYRGVDQLAYVERSDIWGLDPNGELVLIFIIESRKGIQNVHSIAKALHDAGVKAILWAGGGDLALSNGEPPYGGAMPKTIDGIHAVLAAGSEFGLPVGLNDYTDIEVNYTKGARAFFAIGPHMLAASPLTAGQRSALGR